MYVSIGGIDQWVQVGGDDPANPILLYLHGGPGGTSVPAAAAWREWERHFSVVHGINAVPAERSNETARKAAGRYHWTELLATGLRYPNT
jgi:hypothetical protein